MHQVETGTDTNGDSYYDGYAIFKSDDGSLNYSLQNEVW